VYGTYYYANRNYREVWNRYMKATPAGTQYEWDIYRDSSSNWHTWATVADDGAISQKHWTFSASADYTAGLATSYQEIDSSSSVLLEKDFTWTQTAAGSPYVGTLLSKLNPASYNAQTSTVQVLDSYGNLTQSQVYDYYGNLARTYNFSYEHNSYYGAVYVSRYLLNHLTSAAVTPAGGSPITLASKSYDSYGWCAGIGGFPATNASNNHDAAYDASITARGNVTQSSGVSGSDHSCVLYDTAGVPYYTVGPNGSATIQTNSDSSYSLPGVITPNGNGDLASSATYASSWGVTSMTGPNGAQGTTTYDSYGRPSQTQIPDGAVTTYTYTYSPGASTQTATVNGRWKTTTLDGFGRTTRVQSGHGATVISTVDTQYAPCACSPLGKLWRVSQPYAPGATPVWTTYTYDGSGRTLTVTAPDGASTTWYAYAGTYTTVHDPAGKGKTSVVDAFGNLVAMWETDPALGNVSTNYTYNALNQLTTVSMTRGAVTQTRTFTYVGADMVSATNPENGTINYTYDGAHRVTSRTDAKGQQTQYDHDTYGRVTEVRYYRADGYENTTERVDYYYDTIPNSYGFPVPSGFGQNTAGRLAAVTFGGGPYDDFNNSYAYAYSYNQAGRVTGQEMLVVATIGQYSGYPWMKFMASYQWDNEGRMTQMQYPTVSTATNRWYPWTMQTAGYQYDTDGRMNGMTWDSGFGPNPYASATYGPAGEMQTLSYGAGTETRTYNSMLQLTHQVVPGLMDMTYNYSATGANNGRITGSVDAITGENTTYSYDTLNRLTGATASGMWSESYTYDGFGNLTGKTGTGGAPSMTASYDANNHQTGVGYDANGNGPGRYTVENRNMGWGPVYAYDPSGKRVMVEASPGGSGDNNYQYSFYGITGQRLVTVGCTNVDGQTLPSCWILGQNVYFKAKLLVSNGVNVVTDRLGSVRANTQGERFSYYPYGEERTSTVDGREKFGTYFRDGVGQDYADQRYYNGGAGRFSTVDPGGVAAASLSSPTSWNGYAYTGGDPVGLADPSGLMADDPTAEHCIANPDDPACYGPCGTGGLPGADQALFRVLHPEFAVDPGCGPEPIGGGINPDPTEAAPSFSLRFVSACTAQDQYTALFELRITYQLYVNWAPYSGNLAALGVSYISEAYANPSGDFKGSGASAPGAWCMSGVTQQGCGPTAEDQLQPDGTFNDYLSGYGSLTQSFYLNGTGAALLVAFSNRWGSTQLLNHYNSKAGVITVGNSRGNPPQVTSVGAPPCQQ
jgi:RHS repeat-associated protein